MTVWKLTMIHLHKPPTRRFSFGFKMCLKNFPAQNNSLNFNIRRICEVFMYRHMQRQLPLCYPPLENTFNGNTVIKYQQGVACCSKLKKWLDNKELFKIGNNVYVRGKQQVHIMSVTLGALQVLFSRLYKKPEQSD